MKESIRIDRNVPMEMRDGTLLRADVYRQDDNQKHPAIFIRTPYNKLLENGHFLNLIEAAFAGYAIVVQDIRGRFASDGNWQAGGDMSAVEGPDGYDSVEWVASQKWCDGNVGMQGLSYAANLQWITAAENPPHLKAIASGLCGMGGSGDATGVMALALWSSWIATMAVDVADRLEKQGKDASRMRQMIGRALLNVEEVVNFLPLKDVPHFQFDGVREMWNYLLHPHSIRPEMRRQSFDYHKVMVPCLNISGWYDFATFGTTQNFIGMQEKGGSQHAREGQYILMGPWIHSRYLTSYAGDINFGSSAGSPGAQTTEHHLAFFNKYLRGMDVKLPVIRYFLMGKNRWQEADTWPLPQTQWQRFFLHSKGGANTSDGDGLLTRNEPGAESPDIFIYNPHSPVTTTGGRSIPGGVVVSGPVNRFHLEKRHDVLCYTTPELGEETEVTGSLVLHLFAATSAKDTDFTATLIDVYPDGRAYNVADGIVRARFRHSVFEPEMVTPGEVNEYTINLGNTSQLFRKGHRIRIDISSSNFPAGDRNMNTGNAIGEDAQGIPAMQTIFHQQGYASYIDLPVIPAKSA